MCPPDEEAHGYYVVMKSMSVDLPDCRSSMGNCTFAGRAHQCTTVVLPNVQDLREILDTSGGGVFTSSIHFFIRNWERLLLLIILIVLLVLVSVKVSHLDVLHVLSYICLVHSLMFS